MLKGQLLHPEILSALGYSGHGSKILIADGNFPFATKSNPVAKKVALNLAPGIVGAVDVLKALCSVVPIESAMVMDPPQQGDYAIERPGIWKDFESVLNQENVGLQLEKTGRFNFYEFCQSPDVALMIATAEQRIFANLLLTIGVVAPQDN